MKTTILNPLDLTLILTGAAIMSIGLFRAFPITLNKQFCLMNGPLVGMIITAFILVVSAKKPGMVHESINMSTMFASRFMILMVLLCMCMGLGMIIVKLYDTQIQEFILRHHILGPFIAAIVTPTSNALTPIVQSAWNTPSVRPMCLYYLQASALMSFPLFMLRQVGFMAGSTIPWRMYIAGVIMSLIILPLMVPISYLVEIACKFFRIS